MRFKIILVLVFLSSSFYFAQISPVQVLQNDFNITVHSKGLPENFRLFSPDTVSQILSIPSRGADFGRNFVYGTYLQSNNPSLIVVQEDPGFSVITPVYNERYSSYQQGSSNIYETYSDSKSPTLLAASLFNFLDSKWLLVFSNGVSQENTTANSYQQENLLNSNNTSRSNSASGEYINRNWLTTIKAAKIGKTGFGNYSIGLYALIDYLKYSSNINSNYIQSTYYKSDGNYRNSLGNDNDKAISSNKISSYQIGTEITFNNMNWDLKFNLGYQNSVSRWSSTTSENISSFDSSMSYTGEIYGSSSSNFSYTDAKLDWTPSMFIMNTVIHRRVSFITPLDDIYLSVNFYYSPSKLEYRKQYSQNSTSGSNTAENSYRNYQSDYKDNWGVYLSSGYVLNKKFSDLNILTGFEVTYANIKDKIFIDQSILVIDNMKQNSVNFTLPLYLDYHLTEWISFFGGINYVYSYVNQNTEAQYAIDTRQYYGYDTKLNYSRQYKTHAVKSAKENYFGAEFIHKSGLALQIAFQNDFANFKYWDFTIGYQL